MEDSMEKFKTSLLKREQLITSLVATATEGNIVAQKLIEQNSANSSKDHSMITHEYLKPQVHDINESEDETDMKPVLYKRVQELQKLNNDLLAELRVTNKKLMDMKYEKDRLVERIHTTNSPISNDPINAWRTTPSNFFVPPKPNERRGTSIPRETELEAEKKELSAKVNVLSRELEKSNVHIDTKISEMKADYQKKIDQLVMKLNNASGTINRFLSAMQKLQMGVMKHDESNMEKLRKEFEMQKSQLTTLGVTLRIHETNLEKEPLVRIDRSYTRASPSSGTGGIMSEKNTPSADKEKAKSDPEIEILKKNLEKAMLEKAQLEALVETLKRGNSSKRPSSASSKKSEDSIKTDTAIDNSKYEKLISEYKKLESAMKKRVSDLEVLIKQREAEIINLKRKQILPLLKPRLAAIVKKFEKAFLANLQKVNIKIQNQSGTISNMQKIFAEKLILVEKEFNAACEMGENNRQECEEKCKENKELENKITELKNEIQKSQISLQNIDKDNKNLKLKIKENEDLVKQYKENLQKTINQGNIKENLLKAQKQKVEELTKNLQTKNEEISNLEIENSELKEQLNQGITQKIDLKLPIGNVMQISENLSQTLDNHCENLNYKLALLNTRITNLGNSLQKIHSHAQKTKQENMGFQKLFNDAKLELSKQKNSSKSMRSSMTFAKTRIKEIMTCFMKNIDEKQRNVIENFNNNDDRICSLEGTIFGLQDSYVESTRIRKELEKTIVQLKEKLQNEQKNNFTKNSQLNTELIIEREKVQKLKQTLENLKKSYIQKTDEFLSNYFTTYNENIELGLEYNNQKIENLKQLLAQAYEKIQEKIRKNENEQKFKKENDEIVLEKAMKKSENEKVELLQEKLQNEEKIKEFNEKLIKKTKECENIISENAKLHDEISKINKTHNFTIQNLKQKLEKDINSKISGICEKLQKNIQNNVGSNEHKINEISQILLKFKNRISDIKNKHKNELQNLKNNFNMEISKKNIENQNLISENNKVIEKLIKVQTENDQNYDNLKNMLQNNIIRQISDETLKTKNLIFEKIHIDDQKISKISQILSKLRNKIHESSIKHKTDLNNLKSNSGLEFTKKEQEIQKLTIEKQKISEIMENQKYEYQAEISQLKDNLRENLFENISENNKKLNEILEKCNQENEKKLSEIKNVFVNMKNKYTKSQAKDYTDQLKIKTNFKLELDSKTNEIQKLKLENAHLKEEINKNREDLKNYLQNTIKSHSAQIDSNTINLNEILENRIHEYEHKLSVIHAAFANMKNKYTQSQAKDYTDMLKLRTNFKIELNEKLAENDQLKAENNRLKKQIITNRENFKQIMQNAINSNYIKFDSNILNFNEILENRISEYENKISEMQKAFIAMKNNYTQNQAKDYTHLLKLKANYKIEITEKLNENEQLKLENNRLKEQITKNRESFKQYVQNAINSNINQFDSNSVNLNEILEKRIQEYENKISEIQNAFTTMKNKYAKSQAKDYTDQLKLKSNFNIELSQKSSEIEKLQNENNKLKEQIIKNRENFKQIVQNAINSNGQHFDSTLINLNENLENHISEYENKLSETQKVLITIKNKYTQSQAQDYTHLLKLKTNFKLELDSKSTEIQKLNSENAFFKSQIHKNHSLLTDSLQNGLFSHFSTLFTAHNTSVNSLINSHSKRIQNLQDLLTKISQINKNTQTSQASKINLLMSDLLKKDSELSQNSKQITELAEKLYKSQTENAQQISAIQALSQKIVILENSKSEYEQNIADFKENFKNTIFNIIDSKFSNLQGKLPEKIQKINNLQNAIKRLEMCFKNMYAVKNGTKAESEKQMKNLLAKITEKDKEIQEINKIIENQKNDLNIAYTKIEKYKENQEKLKTISQKMNSKFIEIFAKKYKSLELLLHNQGNRLENIYEGIFSVKSLYVNKISAFNSNLLSKNTEIQKNIDQNKELSNKNEKLNEDLQNMKSNLYEIVKRETLLKGKMKEKISEITKMMYAKGFTEKIQKLEENIGKLQENIENIMKNSVIKNKENTQKMIKNISNLIKEISDLKNVNNNINEKLLKENSKTEYLKNSLIKISKMYNDNIQLLPSKILTAINEKQGKILTIQNSTSDIKIMFENLQNAAAEAMSDNANQKIENKLAVSKLYEIFDTLLRDSSEKMQNSLEEKQEKLEILQEKIDNLILNYEYSQKCYLEYKEKYETKEAEYNQLKKKYENSEENLLELNNQIGDKNEKIVQLKMETEMLKNQITELQELQGKLENLQGNDSEKSKTIEKLNKTISEQNTVIITMRGEKAKLKNIFIENKNIYEDKLQKLKENYDIYMNDLENRVLEMGELLREKIREDGESIKEKDSEIKENQKEIMKLTKKMMEGCKIIAFYRQKLQTMISTIVSQIKNIREKQIQIQQIFSQAQKRESEIILQCKGKLKEKIKQKDIQVVMSLAANTKKHELEKAELKANYNIVLENSKDMERKMNDANSELQKSVNSLKEQRELSQKSMQEISTKLMKIQDEKISSEEECEKLREKIVNLENFKKAQGSDSDKKLLDYTNKISILTSEISSEKQKSKDLQLKIDQISQNMISEKKKVKEKLEKLQKFIADNLVQNKAKFEEKLNTITEKCDLVENSVEILGEVQNNNKNERQKILSNLKTNSLNLISQNSENTQKLLQEFSFKILELIEKVNKYKEKQNLLSQDKQKSNKNIEELSKRLEILSKELNNVQNANSKLIQERDEQKQANTDLTNKIVQLQLKMSDIEEIKSNPSNTPSDTGSKSGASAVLGLSKKIIKKESGSNVGDTPISQQDARSVVGMGARRPSNSSINTCPVPSGGLATRTPEDLENHVAEHIKKLTMQCIEKIPLEYFLVKG